MKAKLNFFGVQPLNWKSISSIFSAKRKNWKSIIADDVRVLVGGVAERHGGVSFPSSFWPTLPSNLSNGQSHFYWKNRWAWTNITSLLQITNQEFLCRMGAVSEATLRSRLSSLDQGLRDPAGFEVKCLTNSYKIILYNFNTFAYYVACYHFELMQYVFSPSTSSHSATVSDRALAISTWTMPSPSGESCSRMRWGNNY